MTVSLQSGGVVAQAPLPRFRGILDFLPEELPPQLEVWGYPAYRGRQLAHWLFRRAASSYEEMSNLPKELRQKLMTELPLEPLTVVDRQVAKDGTEKVLLQLGDGAAIETVLLRQHTSRGTRLTACLSTQVGCAIGCPFCATGQQGWVRNLSAGEIVGQVLYWQRLLATEGRALDNVVYMGMGEPLGNYAATFRSVAALNSPLGMGMGARRMTLSTSGLAPQIERMAEEPWQVNLAVSLHAPTNALRDQLVPINQTYPLERLLAAVQTYSERTHRRVTFEYVLLAGVNDDLEQARDLAALLRGMLCHVNLIPLNPEPSGRFSAPRRERIAQFQRVIEAVGIACTVRIDRGQDIAAACGQLARQRRGAQEEFRQREPVARQASRAR